jgi:type VI secretion system protein VasI
MVHLLVRLPLVFILLGTSMVRAEWFVEQEPAETEGLTDVRLSVLAGETVYGNRGQRGQPVLFLDCRENTTMLTVDWGVDLGSGTLAVGLGIDDAAPQTVEFAIGDDGRTLVLQPGSAAIPLIRQLIGHARLAMTTDSASGRLETSFDLNGIDQALTPLREACGW